MGDEFEMRPVDARPNATEVIGLKARRDLGRRRQFVGDAVRVLHDVLTVRIERDLPVAADDIDRAGPE